MTEIPDRMRGKGIKYIFWAFSLLLLIIMVFLSRDAAVSCDEVLHYNQSEEVYRFFATGGADLSALDTPNSHLKYYGQSFDNITTFIIKWLGIDDIYTIRHYMSAIAGWLTVIAAALFAVWLSGYGTGIIVLFLFVVSPVFMGHAQNNLKDVPFALGYISSLFLILKIVFTTGKPKPLEIVLLAVSMAFALSIRAGGLLLFCYLFLFFCVAELLLFLRGNFDPGRSAFRLVLLIMVSGAAYFLGILLWPYALEDPLRNVTGSLHVMSHFPDTFRQIFEGRAEWSDFMPWYYLPKSMALTIPVVVLTGCLLFFVFSGKIIDSGKSLQYGILLFAVIFPLAYAILGRSNLYSSWRQFLFVYPPLVIISATGISFLIRSPWKRYQRALILIFPVLLAIHPVKFMYQNHRYCYLYYNQLARGLKGALGNYETDYYYLGQTEAAEWLTGYLEMTGNAGKVKVGATYSVSWQFRNHPGISTFYMRNEDRSQYDWDYAIITNRYIPPAMLKGRKWPPRDALHVVYADSVPICAILKRGTRDDFRGCEALGRGDFKLASDYFAAALKENNEDEMIFFNFAAALSKQGFNDRADSVLKEALKINPVSEPVLMYLGNIASASGRTEEAKSYYERLIAVNRKYFEAYVRLAGLMGREGRIRARRLLRECLDINPGYKPAIVALADTYRESDPGIARKYDELADKIK